MSRRLSDEVRAGYRREAEECAGKAVGCVFAMVGEIIGVTLGAPHFGNARAFHNFAQANASHALECAAKAVSS